MAQGDILCRVALENGVGGANEWEYCIGLIGARLGLDSFAEAHFKTAASLAPDWPVPRQALRKLGELKARRAARTGERNGGTEERYLLIKAWGYGFWSDVDHVLGQLLVAEITGRVPVIHWGGNSLFGDGGGGNAFHHFFEPVSGATVADLAAEGLTFFPPKWRAENLTQENLNKMGGSWSRVNALYFLNRPECVLVSDFHTAVGQIRNWIPESHPLARLSVHELYRHLIDRYLRPTAEVAARVEAFLEEKVGGAPFVSVHVRGSDKVLEMPELEDLNRQYARLVEETLAKRPNHKIFVMTDDAGVLDTFVRDYGDRVIFTDSERTRGSVGLHYLGGPKSGRDLGMEVITDTYVALRGDAFVGNYYSNVSAIIRLLKDWAAGDVYMLGPDIHQTHNLILNDW